VFHTSDHKYFSASSSSSVAGNAETAPARAAAPPCFW
jgi:hypothetical protein